MDEKKVRAAIDLLQIQICKLEEQKEYDEHGQPLYNETLDIAIEQYEIAIEALKKQMPMKAEYEGGFSNNGFTRYRMAKCPTCDKWYSSNDEIIYCTNCGQKID